MDIDLKAIDKPKSVAKQAPNGMRRILIPKTKDATGDVFVSAAFKPYLIKRGEPVDVPQEVVDVLSAAKQIEYEKRIDPNTNKAEMVPVETVSYPFQILS